MDGIEIYTRLVLLSVGTFRAFLGSTTGIGIDRDVVEHL